MLSDEFPKQVGADVNINNIYISADTMKYSILSVGVIFSCF